MKYLVIFILSLIIQPLIGQSLDGYYEEIDEKGNFVMVQN